jgi:hypothetical protein
MLLDNGMKLNIIRPSGCYEKETEFALLNSQVEASWYYTA